MGPSTPWPPRSSNKDSAKTRAPTRANMEPNGKAKQSNCLNHCFTMSMGNMCVLMPRHWQHIHVQSDSHVEQPLNLVKSFEIHTNRNPMNVSVTLNNCCSGFVIAAVRIALFQALSLLPPPPPHQTQSDTETRRSMTNLCFVKTQRERTA